MAKHRKLGCFVGPGRLRFSFCVGAAVFVGLALAALLTPPSQAASVSSQRTSYNTTSRPATQGEICISIVPALPAFFETLDFKGYSARTGEICFPWEGGALRGQFTMAAGWDYKGDNPTIHGCTIQGRTEGTLLGTFTPRIVAERVVGGSISGNVVRGATSIKAEGPCLSEPDAQGRRRPVIESSSLDLAGIAWKASVSNGLLRGEVPVAGEIPLIIAAPAVAPGGIAALGALGQGPVAGILGRPSGCHSA